MAADHVACCRNPKWEKGNRLSQNSFDDIQQDIHSTAYRHRHHYAADKMEIEGMSYTVVSVVPFSDGDYRPETVQDKLKYLINGKKS